MADIFKQLNQGLNDLGKQAGQLTEQATKFVQEKAEQSEKLSQETMISTLDWAYQTTLNGLVGEKSLENLVTDYLSKYDTETAIEKLIQTQTTKAAVSGFLTGFGGIITIPVTLPANIASVILFQMRMVAAIASMRGYDLKSDQVQTFVYATLAGTSVSEIVKKGGIVIGNKFGVALVKKVPGTVLRKINKAVGFRLATKFGTTGVVNLGKMVPVLGAVVGSAFDMTSTLTIANLAKKTFADTGLKISEDFVLSKEDTQVIDGTYSEKNDLTIYHNQSCSKSLAVLELLREGGFEPRVINYLTETPSPAELTSLGLPAKDLLRTTDHLYTDLGLSENLSDQEIFDLLAEHPSLIQRPIVVYKGQALICRPPERVWELVEKPHD